MKNNKSNLHQSMTVEEFENGYFYAAELKKFAKELGIEVGSLRKNEVEIHIKAFLSGEKNIELPKSINNKQNKAERDTLSPDTQIVNYVSDKQTKNFLLAEIHKKDAAIKNKSGQWYWLNDWRKKQIADNNPITYQSVINKLYELMTTKGKLPRIPSTRFNNFITDFLADPDNAGASRKQAMEAWEILKNLPIQKNYQAYKKAKES